MYILIHIDIYVYIYKVYIYMYIFMYRLILIIYCLYHLRCSRQQLALVFSLGILE